MAPQSIQGATSSPGISVLGSKPLLIQNTVWRFLQSKELRGLSLLPLQFGQSASKQTILLTRGCPGSRVGAIWGVSMPPEPSNLFKRRIKGGISTLLPPTLFCLNVYWGMDFSSLGRGVCVCVNVLRKPSKKPTNTSIVVHTAIENWWNIFAPPPSYKSSNRGLILHVILSYMWGQNTFMACF